MTVGNDGIFCYQGIKGKNYNFLIIISSAPHCLKVPPPAPLWLPPPRPVLAAVVEGNIIKTNSSKSEGKLSNCLVVIFTCIGLEQTIDIDFIQKLDSETFLSDHHYFYQLRQTLSGTHWKTVTRLVSPGNTLHSLTHSSVNRVPKFIIASISSSLLMVPSLLWSKTLKAAFTSSIWLQLSLRSSIPTSMKLSRDIRPSQSQFAWGRM